MPMAPSQESLTSVVLFVMLYNTDWQSGCQGKEVLNEK